MEKIQSLERERIKRELSSRIDEAESFVRSYAGSISEMEAGGRRTRDATVIGLAESCRNALTALSEEVSKAQDNLKGLQEKEVVRGASEEALLLSRARTSLRLLGGKMEIARAVIDLKEAPDKKL